MSGAKRIFIIGNFKDESPQSVRIERRRWVKGFVRLGHDVQRFSYRNMMMQASLIKNRFLAQRLAKKKTDKILVAQVKAYHPDIVFVLNMKYLDSETIAAMRRVAPDAVYVARDNEPFPDKHPYRIPIAKQMDIVAGSSPDEFLTMYREAGVPLCTFIPNPCDPDIQHPYDVAEKWISDIIFTGKVGHSRIDPEIDRHELLLRLSKRPGARLYGCFGNPRIDGVEVFYATSGAKIALSINIINTVRLYHSDRPVNCISCGTFTLIKRVPDSDLLFKDGVHVKYFDTADEFFELADWYLEHDEEREKTARAGMEWAHQEFNCTKLAGYLMDVIEKGSYSAPWTDAM
jgi:spore maturation protein CgeB